MPNDQKEKIETINKIKEHIKTIENPNNLIIIEDFNFVTDALDRLLLHKDNNQISESWTHMTNEYNLMDGQRESNKLERQFTYTQGKSLARIDRIYTTKKIYESTAEWTIEKNNRISDHQIITTTIHSMNLPSIEKGLWKLDIEMIKWNPFKNQIRKLLLETEKKINNTENQETSKLEIWIKTKKEIMKIGKEESIN